MTSTIMTVGELIEALKDLDPTLPVTLEGCDCDGDLGSVRVAQGVIAGDPDLRDVAYLERVR